MRKNGGTRQSKDVSQHQRTSALYIGLLLLMLCVIPGRAVLFSISTSSFLLFFTNSFLCFHPNLLPRSSCFVHHIAFLFLQFSLRLVSCQISSRRNAQVPLAHQSHREPCTSKKMLYSSTYYAHHRGSLITFV